MDEPLSTQPDREGGALLAAGGIDVTDVLALRPGRGCSGHKDGQPQDRKPIESAHELAPVSTVAHSMAT